MATSLSEGVSHISGRPLTNSKHEHFAHLVTKGESPARDYVLCGYSEHGALQSGNRLLRKPDVAARAEELKAAVSERQVEKMAVDRAWVMAKLTENVQRAMQLELVRDREGNPTGQYTYQGAAANKALELLGKELGMFQPYRTPRKSRGWRFTEINGADKRGARPGGEGEAGAGCAEAADSTNLLNREL